MVLFSFDKLINEFKTYNSTFKSFKKTIKDSENIIQTIISQSFQSVRSIESGLFIIDLFYHLNSREPIKRALDRAGMEIIQMINSEMAKIQKTIDCETQYFNNSSLPQGPYKIVFLKNMQQKIQENFKYLLIKL